MRLSSLCEYIGLVYASISVRLVLRVSFLLGLASIIRVLLGLASIVQGLRLQYLRVSFRICKFCITKARLPELVLELIIPYRSSSKVFS